MKVIWYIIGRWYEGRATLAAHRYVALKGRAEKYFARIGGAS